MAKPPQAKRVVVNADDFGFSGGITAGILRAHREGIVTSTTIAANMPAAAEAVGRLTEAPDLGVGVHLNVCQGPPISPEGAELAGADGLMGRSAVGLILACTARPRLLRAIEAEFDAQIRWVLAQGLRPTHLDSHRHVHAFSPIFRRVRALAKRYHIRWIRWVRECRPRGGWPASSGAQRRIGRLVSCFSEAGAIFDRSRRGANGLWGVEHTGRIDAAWLRRAARAVRPGLTEIMTHPGLPSDEVAPGATRLVASRSAELEALCEASVREAFRKRHVELVHYGNVQHS